MANSCTKQREALLKCLSQTECMAKGGTVEDCLNLTDEEGGCMSARISYMQCKRGQLDMRNRFKGNNIAGLSIPTTAKQASEADSGSARE